MATAAFVIGAVLLGMGPALLWLAALLVKVPQLFVVALSSAGLYYLVSCFLMSVWYAILGAERYRDAMGFCAPLAAVVTELVRFYVCKCVLSAERFFQRNDQTIIGASSLPRRLVHLGAGVGLGFSFMYTSVTVGVVANAEVALSWPDRGTSAGDWMPSSVTSTTWLDFESCPQMPKLVDVGMQALFMTVLHIIWSIWMMSAVSALCGGCGNTALQGDPAEQDGVPLTSPHAGEQPHNDGDASPAQTAPTEPTPVLALFRSSVGLSRASAYGLIAGGVGCHILLRFVSLAGSGAASWDAVQQRWAFEGSRGCVVVIVFQGACAAVCGVVSLCLWRGMELVRES